MYEAAIADSLLFDRQAFRQRRRRTRFRAGQEESRGDRNLLGGIVHLGHEVPPSAPRQHLDHRKLVFRPGDNLLGLHAGEKGGELMKLPPFPGVGLVIMTLGALDLDSHKNP